MRPRPKAPARISTRASTSMHAFVCVCASVRYSCMHMCVCLCVCKRTPCVIYRLDRSGFRGWRLVCGVKSRLRQKQRLKQRQRQRQRQETETKTHRQEHGQRHSHSHTCTCTLTSPRRNPQGSRVSGFGFQCTTLEETCSWIVSMRV